MQPEEILSAVADLSVAELGEFEALIRESASAVEGEGPAEVASLVASAAAMDAARAVRSAGGSRIRRMARVVGQPQASPEAARGSGGAVLVASALNGIPAGQEISDRYELASAMCRTIEVMPRHDPPRGRVVLASARWTYPEDRLLTTDQDRNARILDAVIHPAALVASGGICAPVNVDYTVPGWSAADRPLRDGLPAFQADRGGLSYVQPPTIASLAGATSVWTAATDANPAGATKPVVQVVCMSPVTVYLDAVPTRLGFGNMGARFAPEQMAANVDLAAAAAARTAENNLLSLIAAAATANVTSAILLGATRDLLTAVNQAAAGLRSTYRIPRSVMLTAVFPDWVKDLVRTDMAREIGHSQNADWNSLAVTDDQVDELLAASGIKAIWHLDGQPVDGGVYPAQTFTAQTASAAIETFPAKLVWYLFPEGSVQFLDGGSLDLGVVRDSVLDAVNDFELFLETFENVAFRGFTGALTQFVSTLCANGASAGTTSTASACA